MRYGVWAVVACGLLAAGCGERKTEEARPAPQPAAPGTGSVAKAEQPPSPDTVLVEVDGAKLTLGEAQKQAYARFGPPSGQMAPEMLKLREGQMLAFVTEQFVARTLLFNEVERRGILVTPAEEKEGMAKLAATLPPGTSVEDVMQNSGLGEAKFREEVAAGFRINKLLEEATTNKTAVTEAEVTEFVEENPEKVALPERVRARHILIRCKPDDTDADKAEKKAKVEELRAQLTNGADFAELARKHSEDESRQAGGDLGVFGRGGPMPKPLEDAAFSQPTGTVSAVVETQLGYHLVEVLAHDDEGTVPREDVAQYLKSQKQQEAVRSFIEGLKSKAKIRYAEGYAPMEP